MKNIAQLRHLVARMEGRPIAPLLPVGDVGAADSMGNYAGHHFYLGHRTADLLAGPFPCGALHEVVAAPASMNIATGFCLGLLARSQQPNRPFIWLEEESVTMEYGMPYPAGLAAFGLDPARFILVRCHKATDALKAADDALATRSIGGIILSLSGPSKALDFTASRRLHLAAEKAGHPALLLLGKAALKTSSAATRWQIAAAPSQSSGAKAPGLTAFDVTLLRNRTGHTGHWPMQWNLNDQTFIETHADQIAQTALSGPRLSAPAHKPSHDGFAA
ncbi:ImuA family protein [Bartonella sp. LJL80]